ncbi:hypothetical protein OROHE_001243 [Orobanche hederae]
MADRRPFFRFWRKPINRQPTTTTTTSPPTPKTKTPSPPPVATSSAPDATPTAGSQPIGRQPTNTGSSPPNPTSLPSNETSDPKKPSPNETQPTVTTLTSPKNEPKTISPSPSSSSTSRRTPQSRSPPLPSSPSRKSKTPSSTPQQSPQPRSASHLTPKQTPSNTPKERRPNSTSKESRQIGGSTSSSYEAQTLASEEKETQPKIQVKPGGANNETNGVEDASFKHFVSRVTIGDPKKATNDRNASIITLAGENRGACMQMGPNSSKEGPLHIHRGYKINPDESAETNTDGEGSSKKSTEYQPTEVYVNCNVQGINNSIVSNVSIEEKSPGVHRVVTHAPKEPIQSAKKISPLETRKAEFNMSHVEKLTYEPTIRRRCLRGLLLEQSDSDQENPEKPRRHGCRVGCKLKENETM